MARSPALDPLGAGASGAPVELGRAPSMFSSLSSRNFRLFFTGQLVSQIGNWVTLVASTLLVLHLTHNGFAVGLLGAAQFLPVLVLGPFAGLIADRSDKRRLLVFTQTLALLQSLALAAIAFMPHPSVPGIYAVAFVGGIITAFDNPPRRAFVVEMVPERDVNNAVSLNSAMMTGARVFGPALAGLLVTTVGYGWCFAVDAVSYFAVIAGLVAMRSSELRPSPVPPRGPGQVREGMRYVRATPELRMVVIVMAIVGTFAFNFNTVIPLFVTRTLHGSDGEFTILFSVISVGSVTGALVMARRSIVSIRHVMIACLAFGAAMLVMAPIPNLATSFPVAFLIGAASIAFMTTSTAVIQYRAAPEMRGRVLALQTMVFLGSTPIGGPLLGAIIDLTDARIGVAIGGLSALVAGGYGFAAMRRNGSTWSHDTRVVTPNEPPIAAIAEDLTNDADAEATGQVVVV
jgi:MFS family permease